MTHRDEADPDNPAQVAANAALDAALRLVPEGTRITVLVNEVPGTHPDSATASTIEDSRQLLSDMLVSASAVAEHLGIELNVESR